MPKDARQNLTPERIRKLSCPPGKSQVFIWDNQSKLGARCTANGAKSYVFQGELHGKTMRLTLGPVTGWRLEKARDKANEWYRLVRDGIDPREVLAAEAAAEKALQADREAAEKYTLKALGETYVEYLEAKGKAQAAGNARSLFNCWMNETETAKKAAKAVTSEEIADLLRAPRREGKERTAGKLRSYLLAAYECALKAPLDDSMPASMKAYGVQTNPARAVPAGKPKAGERTLTLAEMRDYMASLGDPTPPSRARLHTIDSDRMADMVLWTTLLAGGQRLKQVLRATVSDWDSESKTLTLYDPKGKRTQPRKHVLPLADKAAAIVDALASVAKSINRPWIFATTDKATSEATVSKRRGSHVAAMKCPPFTSLAIRRTVETMLAAPPLSVSSDVRAQLLSHGLGGVQMVHYVRHDYLQEKKQVLKAWEAHLFTVLENKPKPKRKAK